MNQNLEIMKKRNKISWMHLLRGVLFIIVAILIFRKPLASIVAITATIGLLIAMAGSIFIAGSITFRKFYKKWKWTLAFGILDVILGFILLFNPAITTPILVIFIGSWAVTIGVLEVSLSFGIKKFGFKKWWTVLLIGLMSMAFGIIIILNPVLGALSVSIFMGMQFLFYGSFLIVKGIPIEDTEKSQSVTLSES